MSHKQLNLSSGSPYVGRMCPVTRQPLQIGEAIVVCTQMDSAISERVFREGAITPACPMCKQPVKLSGDIRTAAIPIPLIGKPAPAADPAPYRSRGSNSARTAIIAAGTSLLVLLCILGLLVQTNVLSVGAPPSVAGGPIATEAPAPTSPPAPAPISVAVAASTAVPPTAQPATAETRADPTRTAVPSTSASVSRPAILSRANWDARSAASGLRPHTPVRIVLTHEEGQICCDGEDPRRRIRANQNVHMDKGWPDIAFHFIIASDGSIFEGRDPQYEINSSYAAINPGYEINGTIVIGVLGNYNQQSPTDASLNAISELMAWISQEYTISVDNIYHLRDLAPNPIDTRMSRTTSPGNNMPEASYFRSQVRELLQRN